MTSPSRPLSPHLQIYQPQITSVMSILHRTTGVISTVGVLLIAIWLVLLMGSGVAFTYYAAFLGSVFGQFLLFVWSLSVFYHLCNGIRHLLWDAGYGFEKNEYRLSGKIVWLLTIVLTLFLWALIGLQN